MTTAPISTTDSAGAGLPTLVRRTFDILVIKYGALGDVIRTSYILPGLVEKYPDARITWLTAPGAADLLRFNPYIDRLITSPAALKGPDADFELVISLDDEPEALKVLEAVTFRRLVGAKMVDGKPGYTEDAATWFDMGLISRHGKAEADRRKRANTLEHNRILELMLELKIARPIFFTSTLVERQMKTLVSDAEFTIGLNSAAGKRWTSKALRMEEAVALVQQLVRWRIGGKPVRVLLLGGADEQERNRQIGRGLAPGSNARIVGECSLLRFAAVIKHCDYIISSDSLALHLAISQCRPTLSFFAPTSAAEIGTFGNGVKLSSLAPDYCSYTPTADNATITAARILALAREHLGTLHLAFG